MPGPVYGSQDRDIRVGDYLDDKLQTLSDFESLDGLLQNVRNQHVLLQAQLQQAQSDLEKARRTSHEHETSVKLAASQFEKDQIEIDRRLLIITRSDTSDEALQKFEPIMDKLRRLEIANGYVKMMAEVNTLSKECRSQLSVSDENALATYGKLRKLSSALVPLQEAAEGAAPHLIDHVSKTAESCHLLISEAFVTRMEALLRRIQWPKANAGIPMSMRDEWQDITGKLLDLQRPELEAKITTESRNKNFKVPDTLLPFQVLVKPLELRFRYHFDGEKATNRLDKPEYFLQHVQDILAGYSGFVADELQPVLLQHFKGTDLAFSPAYIDATSALITAVLPMLRAKVVSILPAVAGQPQLLSHLMHELMQFDTTIRDEWGYASGFGMEGWKGITWEVLVERDWFGRWLQVEKDFALQRYQDIIDTDGSGELDFDSVDFNSTKPTKAAIRVNDLLETITDRYRPLTSFSQKLRFLLDIQISIFDRFHARLHESLEAYLTMTSSIGRRVQGISTEEQGRLQGIEGLDRLCRVYGSANYLEKAMRDWSDDIFFLELWDELQDRARNRAPGDGKNLAGPMSMTDIAQRTSNTVGSEEDTGALFDETAGAYGRLRVRSEGIIIDVLNQNVRDVFRAYRNINPWASLTTLQTGGLSSTTAELDPILAYLKTSLDFLSRALAPAPLQRIVRSLCQTIDATLFDQILLRRSFSSSGAAQLSTDLEAVKSLLEHYVGDSVVRRALARAAEGIRLLSLPVRQGQSSSEKGDYEEAEDQVNSERRWGLWEVEKKVFASNESARTVLEDMGMENLTEQEARGVLERRIELSS